MNYISMCTVWGATSWSFYLLLLTTIFDPSLTSNTFSTVFVYYLMLHFFQCFVVLTVCTDCVDTEPRQKLHALSCRKSVTTVVAGADWMTEGAGDGLSRCSFPSATNSPKIRESISCAAKPYDHYCRAERILSSRVPYNTA